MTPLRRAYNDVFDRVPAAFAVRHFGSVTVIDGYISVITLILKWHSLKDNK